MSEATFSVKNFEKFQHYKDRSPPWIRLYNSLLDDYEFGRLPDASKAHLLAIWLLASRYENKIPYDPEWVSRRINATEPVDLDALAGGGFIVVDQPRTVMLAPREQDANPEKSRVETEKKEDNPPPQARGGVVVLHPEEPENEIPAVLDRRAYPDKFEAVWDEYKPIASKNATKADAFRAWQKLSASDQQSCYAGVVEYAMWLQDERKRRPDTPAKHLATFINKRGWEPFEEADHATG